jgi:hypothetical protein
MNRLSLGFVAAIAVTGCGPKEFGSLCDQVPAPAACMTACDPAPGAANMCPAGYYFAPDGYCDAQCTPNSTECGDGYVCTGDGRCVDDGQHLAVGSERLAQTREIGLRERRRPMPVDVVGIKLEEPVDAAVDLAAQAVRDPLAHHRALLARDRLQVFVGIRQDRLAKRDVELLSRPAGAARGR